MTVGEAIQQLRTIAATSPRGDATELCNEEQQYITHIITKHNQDENPTTVALLLTEKHSV